MAWFGHERVGFWASFSDAGFGAFGAEGDDILSEDLE